MILGFSKLSFDWIKIKNTLFESKMIKLLFSHATTKLEIRFFMLLPRNKEVLRKGVRNGHRSNNNVKKEFRMWYVVVTVVQLKIMLNYRSSNYLICKWHQVSNIGKGINSIVFLLWNDYLNWVTVHYLGVAHCTLRTHYVYKQ